MLTTTIYIMRKKVLAGGLALAISTAQISTPVALSTYLLQPQPAHAETVKQKAVRIKIEINNATKTGMLLGSN